MPGLPPRISPTPPTNSTIVTPSPPPFVNSPDLQVTSIYDGMTAYQGSSISVQVALRASRPMGSLSIIVANKDGTTNTTLVDRSQESIIKAVIEWNVTAEAFPVGDYDISVVVKPNATADASWLPGSPSTLNVQPLDVFTTGAPMPSPPPTKISYPIPTNSPIDTATTTIGIRPPPTILPTIYYWRARVHVAAPKPGNEGNGVRLGVGLLAIAFGATLSM
ncbi:hypothetical protein BGW38_004863 [Lunasporangiospora selenospora]|uniref:Uncharacterized protein n=1 Tax=Lunasporangiospora selenospora TaxID=979761 RepID=A0A9P6FPK3_9FUNG|nr:hypothetical protein BGW38_004863 [Lunasporangiospora selenospora]